MRLLHATVLAAALAASQGAFAAACSPNNGFNLGATTDLKIGSTSATSCRWFNDNNDSASDLNAANFGGPNDWTPLVSVDDDDAESGTIGGVTMTLTGVDDDRTSDSFTFSWSGGPAIVDLAFVVKSSNEYFAYFFDDFSLSPASGSASGSYLVSATNRFGWRQDLSHLSLYARDVTPTTTTTVPLPGSLALLGLGGLAAGLVARRRGTRA